MYWKSAGESGRCSASSLPPEKLSSTRTRFRLRVPAKGEVVLTYRVRVVVKPVTLAHLSDLHFGRDVDLNQIEALEAFIPALQPDAIVISGDLSQRARHGELQRALAFVKTLRRAAPTSRTRTFRPTADARAPRARLLRTRPRAQA